MQGCLPIRVPAGFRIPVVHPGISLSCLETVAVLQVNWSCKIAPRAQIGDTLSRGILYLLTAQGSLLALEDAEII